MPKMEQKDVFVTYAWDTNEHQQKVTDFVIYLRENGYDAEFDKIVSQKETATDFTKMMTKAMTHYKSVIVVLSKKYKEKATDFEGGAGKEYELIIKDIDDNPKKYILVSFGDERKDISPLHFKDREVIDISNLKQDKKLQNELNAKLQKVESEVYPDPAPKKPNVISELADAKKEKYFQELKSTVNKELENCEYAKPSLAPKLKELSGYFNQIGDFEELLLCEMNILSSLTNPEIKETDRDENEILLQAEKVLTLLEKYANVTEFDDAYSFTIRLILSFVQKQQKRDCEKELSLIYKLMEVQKNSGKDYSECFLGLATTFYTMKNYEEAENQIHNYFNWLENKGIKQNAENSTGLYIFLSQIQHDALKFKEALESIEKIEKFKNEYVVFSNEMTEKFGSKEQKQMKSFASHLAQNIDIFRNTNLWKYKITQKLETLNNTSLSVDSFGDFKGIREFTSFANGLFLRHVEVTKKGESSNSLGFMYDYWGKCNYEWLILANRFFEEKDTAIKVKVNSIEQMRNYLKILPLYSESIIFLWAGELIVHGGAESAMMTGIPTFYPKYTSAKNYVLMNASVGSEEMVAIVYDYLNFLPEYVFDFMLGEAKPLFENGYFTIVPMVQGGYIEHNKSNLVDRLMDNILKPVSVINIGNIHSNNYLQLPYIQNISFPDLLILLDEQKTDLRRLRKGIKAQQKKIQQGASQSDISQIVDEIKDGIEDLKDTIKKANRNYKIDYQPSGSDFFDLETSFNKYVKDYLSKANEELGITVKKIISENPYSIFIKTEFLNKSWNISPKYLLEDLAPVRPSNINHWLHGTSDRPHIRNITQKNKSDT